MHTDKMSLSVQTINIVKATAPVVGANALKITDTFYKTMFKNHPETLHYFNKTNQKKGKSHTHTHTHTHTETQTHTHTHTHTQAQTQTQTHTHTQTKRMPRA